MNFLKRICHSSWYQGRGREYPYFEGWYYKVVDADERIHYAIIPGIFKGPEPRLSQAFVQFLDGLTGDVTFYRYPVSAFRAAVDDFDVRIGPNCFAEDGVILNLRSPERVVQGVLRFSGVTPWPVTLLSPGIMGWYAWMPFMECYHGIVSLDHAVHGELAVDGRPVDLTGGRGYTEKDWGRGFPEAWVWFQSNHFDQPGTSVTASVAMIPWLWWVFRGFIVGVWHAGYLYRFATYTGARIEHLAIGDDEIEWVAEDSQHRLEMVFRRAGTGLLYAPTVDSMRPWVPETLQAMGWVRLSDLPSGQVIVESEFRNGGLEVVGDVDRLKT